MGINEAIDNYWWKKQCKQYFIGNKFFDEWKEGIVFFCLLLTVVTSQVG